MIVESGRAVVGDGYGSVVGADGRGDDRLEIVVGGGGGDGVGAAGDDGEVVGSVGLELLEGLGVDVGVRDGAVEFGGGVEEGGEDVGGEVHLGGLVGWREEGYGGEGGGCGRGWEW